MTQTATQAPTYTAILNFDIKGSGSGQAANLRTQLYKALLHLGWEKAKTTSLVIETSDLNAIWKGMLCFTKMQAQMGTLSAVSFTVQRTDDAGSSTPAADQSEYEKIRDMNFPWGSKEQQ